ncbi:hypothetical protein [Winogradskyella ursingii]|uniref:hypothetical protein n=1 Tax=Winogradskyella ursingii TaxID=2686079 RepID=UPI0015CB5C95|nr:hypothetical protein [Winogradskyella ursingii]
MEARADIIKTLEIMDIDDIKNIWKQDMNVLEHRVRVNEEKIKTLELNKATTTFDKFLKISLAGKNMALVYALISFFIIYKVWDSPFFVIIVSLGAAAMIFSFLQHSPLKKLDLGKLGIVALQEEIYKFRMHTAKTAIYDMTIVGLWMATVGVGVFQIFSGGEVAMNLAKVSAIGFVVCAWFAVAYFGARHIYKDIDVKLKETEDGLEQLRAYKSDI